MISVTSSTRRKLSHSFVYNYTFSRSDLSSTNPKAVSIKHSLWGGGELVFQSKYGLTQREDQILPDTNCKVQGGGMNAPVQC